MKIKFILAIFVTAILSSSGYGLAAQPAEFINIPFAEPATMDGGTKKLNINIWKGVGDDPQPVVLFVHGGQWELGNNDLIKTYVTPQVQTLLSLRESGITVAGAQMALVAALSNGEAAMEGNVGGNLEYDSRVAAALLLDDRAPHGALGPESQAVIKSYILRILLK